MDPNRLRYSRSFPRGRSPANSSQKRKKPKEKCKDCCRKTIAFMCTQVGVGALILCYTMVGAVMFMSVEQSYTENNDTKAVAKMRNETVRILFDVAKNNNIFDQKEFHRDMNRQLHIYQDKVVKIFVKPGFEPRNSTEIWNFPAALMYSLSIITMVGYGNVVPRTTNGKILTMVYALFGIPLYILYFKNMGQILAGVFKWVYRRLYKCSTERPINEPHKKIIVPSTACLWVIFAYVITGAIMFGEWEHWGFLDSIYFCVTSLCKLGLGDYVPGADVSASTKDHDQTKLIINFIYMLLGLGLVAMCYNLMREEIKMKLNEMSEDFNQCLEDTKFRVQQCCGKCKKKDSIEYEDYETK